MYTQVLIFQMSTYSINMSNNKSTTPSVSDVPCFNGRNFQGWSEKMIGVFMIAKVYGVISGETVKPADSEYPQMQAPPAIVTDQTDANTVTVSMPSGISTMFNSTTTIKTSTFMTGRCHLGMILIPKPWEYLTEP